MSEQKEVRELLEDLVVCALSTRKRLREIGFALQEAIARDDALLKKLWELSMAVGEEDLMREGRLLPFMPSDLIRAIWGISKEVWDLRLEELFPEKGRENTRVYNALKRAGFTMLGPVLLLDENDLMGIRNLNKKGIALLHRKFAEKGVLHLALSRPTTETEN